MANADAWNLGWQTGTKLAEAQRLRKEQLSDEQRQIKVNDLFAQRKGITDKLPYLSGDERKKAEDALDTIHTSIEQIYHPVHNPGALQKDWHWFSNLVHKARTPAVLSTTSQPGEAIAATPEEKLAGMPGQDVTLPGRTINVNGQKIDIPPTSISAGTQNVTLAATPATAAPVTTTVTAKTAAMTPQQRQGMAQRQRAHAATALDVAASALSPEAAAKAKVDAVMASVDQLGKLLGTDWDEDSRKQYIYNALGINPKEKYMTQLATTIDASGKPHYYRIPLEPGRQPEEVDFDGQTMAPKATPENADMRMRKDFAEYQKQHPEYKGTFEQWKVEQAQLGRLAVPTNKDDRYIAIEQKRQLHQPLTEDEQAYSSAYDLYVQKRIIDPMYARAAAFGDNRYVQVMDPQDPDRVVFMRAKQAAAQGAGSPASIGFQIDKAITRYMIAGQGATNINYFNTAVDHLKLLSQTAEALNNGDIQMFNAWGNSFATATGDPAPTNFETVKSAVAGELSKTFKGTGATDAEISQINQEINQAESPQQLRGAIAYYLRLMDGKLNALRTQFQQGKQGQPAFGAPPAGGGGAPEYVYITDGKRIIRGKKGTPIPQGWTITNAPAGAK